MDRRPPCYRHSLHRNVLFALIFFLSCSEGNYGEAKSDALSNHYEVTEKRYESKRFKRHWPQGIYYGNVQHSSAYGTNIGDATVDDRRAYILKCLKEAYNHLKEHVTIDMKHLKITIL